MDNAVAIFRTPIGVVPEIALALLMIKWFGLKL
jgi:hypothetical protein